MNPEPGDLGTVATPDNGAHFLSTSCEPQLMYFTRIHSFNPPANTMEVLGLLSEVETEVQRGVACPGSEQDLNPGYLGVCVADFLVAPDETLCLFI